VDIFEGFLKIIVKENGVSRPAADILTSVRGDECVFIQKQYDRLNSMPLWNKFTVIYFSVIYTN